MALAKAVQLGSVTAIGVPCFLRDMTDQLSTIVTNSTMHLRGRAHQLDWNWPVFGVVTLASWALLKSTEGR